MLKENLPEKINPARLTEAGVDLNGVFLVKNLQRLRSSLASDEGQVAVKLHFGVDQQDVDFLRGHIETQLVLQCQRCLETFSRDFSIDFLSGIVTTEEKAKELPDRYEPVTLEEDGMLMIQDLVEDELIVALPIVPMHNANDCQVKLPQVVLDSDQKFEKDNPFKVIEILRTQRKSGRDPE